MSRIEGPGSRGVGPTDDPNRPKASAGLRKLSGKANEFTQPHLANSTKHTTAYLRKSSGKGLPKAGEKQRSRGEVGSTAGDAKKIALSTMTKKGFSGQLRKLPRSDPFDP